MPRSVTLLAFLWTALVAITASSWAAAEPTVRVDASHGSTEAVHKPLPLKESDSGFAGTSETLHATFLRHRGAEDGVRVQAQGYESLALRTTRIISAGEAGEVAATEMWPLNRATAAELMLDEPHRLRYPEVYPGVAEEYAVFASRVKHELVLGQPLAWPAAAHAAGYETVLRLPEGYELSAIDDDLHKAVPRLQVIAPDGRAPYQLPRPVAIDASGEQMHGVYRVEQTTTGDWYIRVLISRNWLDQAHYPVRIDPTIEVGTVPSGNLVPFQRIINETMDSGRFMQSYSANQLTMGGDITRVGIQFNSTGHFTFDRIEIWLGESTHDYNDAVNVFDDNFNVTGGGPELVYDGPVTFNVESGDFGVIQLQQSYSYSGNNNLLVDLRIHEGFVGTGELWRRSESSFSNPISLDSQNWSRWTDQHDGTSGSFSGSANNLMGASFSFAPLMITDPPYTRIEDAYEGDVINEQFDAQGGTAPYTFATSSPLPAGITLDSNGELTGTLQTGAADGYIIEVEVTDATSQTTTVPFTWGVYALPEVQVDSLETAIEGFPYEARFVTAGGKPPFTYTLSSTPAFPASLTFNQSTGEITGVPQDGDAGTYNLTVTTTDYHGFDDTLNTVFEIEASHSVTLVELPDATEQGNYGPLQIETAGGFGPFLFVVDGLPEGIGYNSVTGLIYGSPLAGTAADSPYTVEITAIDINNLHVSETYSLVVRPGPSVATSSLPDGEILSAYSVVLEGENGVEPYTWAVAQQPIGLAIDAETGEFTGVPQPNNPATDFSVEFTITDANGASSTRTLTLTLKRDLDAGGGGCGSTTPSGTAAWLLSLLALLALLLARRTR